MVYDSTGKEVTGDNKGLQSYVKKRGSDSFASRLSMTKCHKGVLYTDGFGELLDSSGCVVLKVDLSIYKIRM